MARQRASESETPEIAPEAPAIETKMDAVKAAIAAGVDMPTAGSAYVMEQYGMDVSPQLFSVYKGNLKKKGQKKPRKYTRRSSGTTAPSPVKTDPDANGKDSVADSLETIKKLVDELGVEQVMRIAKLFG